MKRKSIILLTAALIITSFSCSDNSSSRHRAKFEPEDGVCLLFAGQDLKSIGGTPDNDEGYCDTFETPAGLTLYVKPIADSDKVQGLEPLNKLVEYERYKNCMVAIGFSLRGFEKAIVDGELDEALKNLAEWLKGVSPRPVILRIAYEFDYADNHYDKALYIPMFRHVHDYIQNCGVDNVAYAWQSKGWGLTYDEIESYYPGDDYVDWCAYSYFDQSDTLMIEFARNHGKPVFIAESCATTQDGNDNYDDCYLHRPDNAERLWNEWFEPLLKLIKDNNDVIKIWHYINTDWYNVKAWQDNMVFQKCDSRLQTSDLATRNWNEKVIGDKFFVQGKDLDWNTLGK